MENNYFHQLNNIRHLWDTIPVVWSRDSENTYIRSQLSHFLPNVRDTERKACEPLVNRLWRIRMKLHIVWPPRNHVHYNIGGQYSNNVNSSVNNETSKLWNVLVVKTTVVGRCSGIIKRNAFSILTSFSFLHLLITSRQCLSTSFFVRNMAEIWLSSYATKNTFVSLKIGEFKMKIWNEKQ